MNRALASFVVAAGVGGCGPSADASAPGRVATDLIERCAEQLPQACYTSVAGLWTCSENSYQIRVQNNGFVHGVYHLKRRLAGCLRCSGELDLATYDGNFISRGELVVEGEVATHAWTWCFTGRLDECSQPSVNRGVASCTRFHP